MKSIKVLASILLFAITIFVANSCSKDNNYTTSECCTWVDNSGYSTTYCKSNDDWKIWYASWDIVVDEANYYNGRCN